MTLIEELKAKIHEYIEDAENDRDKETDPFAIAFFDGVINAYEDITGLIYKLERKQY